ncbi:helicase [Salegentibacter sp. BLCTC]|uniref:helicase-related protein n=1 Tax=Salegentibacter sp. BLCTC TaxID=2697368 RepID=UPI00187B8456|nr:helicase-related protein [Salegentibacter sp. BLCTC]MBE7640387.1 helicase [Salegentibacter sp. BLCTC]
MSQIFNKREELERFIREQTLGPGISGYRFVNLEATCNADKDLKIEFPINNEFEILNTMPAALYSTGILFPKDKSDSAVVGAQIDANDDENGNDNEEEEKDVDNLKDDLGNVDGSDTLELNQMFPQAMGLTFCMKEKFVEDGNMSFNISARYYQKIKKDKLLNVGVLCEVNPDLFSMFLINNNLSKYINIVDYGVNKCIKAIHKLSNEDTKEINQILRLIDQNKAKEIFEKDVKAFINGTLNFTPPNLSSLTQTIFSELKNKTDNSETRKKLYEASQKVELLENYKNHIKDLINLYRNTIWASENLKAEVKISNINFESNKTKKTYLAYKSRDYSENIEIKRSDNTISDSLEHLFKISLDDEEYASLSANIQLSRDSRKSNNKVFVKIQLINDSTPFKVDPKGKRYYSVATEKVNNKAFFGVKITSESKNIIPYTNYEYKKDEDNQFNEDTTTKFIYHQFEDYAIGHGCSVNWKKQNTKVRVETEYLPACETPDIEPVPRNKNKEPIKKSNGEFTSPPFLENPKPQEFKWLSTFSNAENQEVVSGLLEFVDSYGKWIQQKRRNSKYQSEYEDIANQELNKCHKDYIRMKKNIESLLKGESNVENLNSFRLMNAAMFMQLFHSEKVKNGEIGSLMAENNFSGFNLDFYKKADDRLFSKTESAGWRAFQLAFILLNLDGIFKPENDDQWTARNEWVDLVWFPTGGGKTEAYLGLIALTIINRRKLHKEEGGGVAAIMRYTLRLLTMQQFQRATLVIMALELLRRWDENQLGLEPISIGLWVGDNSLPNSMEGLLEELQKLKEGKKNKIPFTNCPWCNSKLRPIPNGVIVSDKNDIFNNGKANIYCDNNKCSFTPGKNDVFSEKIPYKAIPVNLCDETIFQHPPSLLFGTVDKFAQLAHKVDGNEKGRSKDSRRLFGIGNWEQGKPQDGYLPPDLIIQDELHLLLGPLGSAVSLFEAAVDQLCTREDGTRPKIISSTATTRNTQLQIAALFGREVNLFPKPGVECDDSFFAFYKRRFIGDKNVQPEYIAKRKYVGVLPTGRTQIWMQMRLSAILMTHRVIFELKGLGNHHPINFEEYDKKFTNAMNYYHTIISYFNSLKEVGKTQSQVQTYILKEFRKVFNRVLRPQKLMHALYTYGPIQEAELTGRLSGEEVKNELKNVESEWKPENRFAHIENESKTRGKVPPEFVVATNMISVGIDVSRFNTIIMNSMPRNTAEYIQASSRVARNDYGLVLTVHHPFRARDISHYEKFIEFHEKMYSYVEPISITPFTKKAIERYLGLYLATMIRHTQNEFTNRNTANTINNLTDGDINELIYELMSYFELKKTKLDSFDSLIQNLLKVENLHQIKVWLSEALNEWKNREEELDNQTDLVFNRATNRANQQRRQEQLYVDIDAYEGSIHSKKWQVPMSLRVIEPEAAIKINSI